MLSYCRRAVLLSKVEFVTPKPEPPIQSKQLTPIPPARLYRRLLKLFMCKFDSDTETIVKAWKQTRYEFWCNRDAEVNNAEVLNVKGQQICEAIRAGIIPIYHNSKTKQTYYKYDKDTLSATHNYVDPITPEEFVRRYHTYMDSKDVHDIIASLKKVGRWNGPDELRDEDVFRLKTKHKSKCTELADKDIHKSGT